MYYFFHKGIKEIKERNKLQQNLMKPKPVAVKKSFKEFDCILLDLCDIFLKKNITNIILFSN